MAEGTYYPSMRPTPTPSGDPYTAFAEIFGREPPPGRLPTRPASQPPPASLAAVAVPATTPATAAGYNRTFSANSQVAEPHLAKSASTTRLNTSNRSASNASLNSGNNEYGGHQARHSTNATSGGGPVGSMAGQGQQGITRSVSQVWSGLRQNVAPRSLSSASYTTKQRGTPTDGRAYSLTGGQQQAVTRGGRAIPHRMGDAAGFGGSQYSAETSQTAVDTLVTRKASSSTINSLSTLARSTIVTTSRREPLVYPAFLSKVALMFSQRIDVGDRIKNELTYKNSFTGSEAVSVIADIIKTPDRNLALLLGRALDAQKFFHDVTYDNRLRDSSTEVYQFSTGPSTTPNQIPEPQTAASAAASAAAAATAAQPLATTSQDTGVNGVFTLLAECYSPTCTRDKLCYSISCPRRLEQQARLNMKLDPGLQSIDSRLQIQQGENEERKLWIHAVPPDVAERISKEEQKRQEVIYELIYTERDFVKNLEYVRDFWIKPLRRTNIIPETRRDKFVRTVFLNIIEIHDVNIKFAEALSRLQQEHVVEQVANVVLDFAPRFQAFIRYGALQLYGKYEFERELALNSAFAKFVEETERLPESQKLELNGYLSKPTTRLARYPLLLEAILKQTSENNPDHDNIPLALAKIREILNKVNIESGKTENRFALAQLNQFLLFRPGEYIDLKLLDDKRQLIYDGNLQRRPGEGELRVYLFDHALLLVKNKTANKREVLKVNSKPIPLELLRVSDNDEIPLSKGSSTSMASTSGFRKGSSMIRGNKAVDSYPITLQHLGRRGYDITLYAETHQARKAWVDQILKQQEAARKKADVFSQHTLQSKFFGPPLHVTCARPFDGGRRLLYGTGQGVYLSEITYEGENSRSRKVSKPTLVLQVPNVAQIDVLEIYGLVLFLSDKVIYSLPLDTFDAAPDPVNTRRKARFVANNATFYKVEECMGRTLLSVVKSHSFNATIRVLEPTDSVRSSQRRPQLRRLLTAGGATQSAVEGFKTFANQVEVPSAMLSISYLRRHLCLGCSKGFELLDLNTLKFESLLDPADTSLDFVIRKDSLRPISIYRIGKEFLLNYSDFSFFINQDGWRSRPEWIIQWESVPQHIVLSYPYLVAFEPNFIEIRNMDTELLRAIPGENIRFLHESTHELLYVQADAQGWDEVVAINFWEKQKRLDQV